MLADASQAAHSAAAQAASILLGVVLVASVLVSALETVVLPRNSFTRISRATFAVANRILVHDGRNRERSTHLRGLYAPVALVTLPLVWMLTVITGFSFIFWGAGAGTWQKSFEVSGSSVTTLGFSAPSGSLRTWISFVEAIIGLGLVALLISYLPTIYAAHHDREKGVRTLKPFAGSPTSAVGLLVNLDRFHALDNADLWRTASAWLLELDQTHCSFPALCYFPESDDTQSWVATVGTLLDAGALLLSASPIQWADATTITHQGPMIVLANGVPTVIEIGRAAGLPVDPPVPLVDLLPDGSGSPPAISVTREEYLEALDRLAGILAVPADQREEAWLRFAAVRASYDRALRGLAGLTLSIPAPWTTDRPAVVGRPRLVTSKPISVDWSLPPAAPIR
ncbi:MAG TPA: hypothetical protein VMU90_02345 [Solirubrobacteraceae bacterium]|nr:hypothetical protein [Solirubrobacteraceae bacterium]